MIKAATSRARPMHIVSMALSRIAVIAIPYVAGLPDIAHAAQDVLNSSTTWTVPDDWNGLQNTIEVIGAGGGRGGDNSGGSAGVAGGTGSTGGGSGASAGRPAGAANGAAGPYGAGGPGGSGSNVPNTPGAQSIIVTIDTPPPTQSGTRTSSFAYDATSGLLTQEDFRDYLALDNGQPTGFNPFQCERNEANVIQVKVDPKKLDQFLDENVINHHQHRERTPDVSEAMMSFR